MTNNYIVYHLHDEDSLLDSCTNYKDYIDRAKELNQNAICFTNHGNVYNWYKRKEYCDEIGIKFMYGIECYLTERFEENNNRRDNYHTILIAKNREGFVELNRLISQTTKKDHMYYKPRLSFDEFLGISDNIIKISACIQSPLYQYKKEIQELNKDGIDTKDKMDIYIKLAKHYDYYELQYHNSEWQIEYNQYLYKISKMYNKPLIVGSDTHSLNKYKQECRTMLQYGKTKKAWGDSENECDLTYKSYNELVDMFKIQDSLPMDIILDAINNTNVMADSVEPLVIDKSIKYPILYKGQDEEKIMWDRLRDKYKEKVSDNIIDGSISKYADNIKEEMRVFKKINMVGFMLFMSEMMSWLRDNHIFTSPCRGSVGGSTVAYISDIIDVDPIKWNTVFSRFANEDREEVGDIDIDVYKDERQLVYDYIFNRFGVDKTAYILAVGTLADKSVIDTIGRGLRKIAELNHETTIYTLDKIKEIKKEYDEDRQSTIDKYSDLFYYYDGLVGCTVSQSQHPAGVVASPISLIDNYSVFYGEDGQQILPIDMDEVHEIGLVKYDILGLKNVGIIEKSCRSANIPLPYAHLIDWKDQNVFKDMMQSPIGIFQFEGDYAFKLLSTYYENCNRDGKDFTVGDMSICNACLRPSGESYRNELIARIPHKNPSVIIDKLLESNNGYLVYQEDTIKFLQQICGLSGSDADNVRRAIGRKQLDRLQKALPQILDGYCNVSNQPRNIAEEEAKEFLQIIEDSASYQFGYNHSTGYSMVGYLCAYMRYYYPIDFCTAFLNCSETDVDIYNGTMLSKQRGFEIEMPKFRKSVSEFNCDEKEGIIYKGLGSIKDIGGKCGDRLYTLKDNDYETVIELFNDIKSNSLANKKEINILIKIEFFNEFGDINLLLQAYKIFDSLIKRSTLKKIECEELGLDLNEVAEYCEKETDKQFSKVNMVKVLNLIVSNIEYVETTELEHMCYEIMLLGYTNRIDDSYTPSIYIVEQINLNQYGTPYISLYQPCSGISMTYKCDKKWYNEYKCEVGDVLECVIDTKEKRTKVDNKWVATGEYEEYIKVYCVKERLGAEED